jgi:hypothetical protein
MSMAGAWFWGWAGVPMSRDAARMSACATGAVGGAVIATLCSGLRLAVRSNAGLSILIDYLRGSIDL